MAYTPPDDTEQLKQKVHSLMQVWHGQAYLHYQLALSQNYATQLMKDVLDLCCEYDMNHMGSIIGANLFTQSSLFRAMYSEGDAIPEVSWPPQRRDMEAFVRSYCDSLDEAARGPVATSTPRPKQKRPAWVDQEPPRDEQYLTTLEALKLKSKPPLPTAPRKKKAVPGEPQFIDITDSSATGATGGKPATTRDLVFGKSREPVFNINQREVAVRMANKLLPRELRSLVDATEDGIKIRPGHATKIRREIDNTTLGIATTAYVNIREQFMRLAPETPTLLYLFPIQQELAMLRKEMAIKLAIVLYINLRAYSQQQGAGTNWPPAYHVAMMFGLSDDVDVEEIRGSKRKQ